MLDTKYHAQYNNSQKVHRCFVNLTFFFFFINYISKLPLVVIYFQNAIEIKYTTH